MAHARVCRMLVIPVHKVRYFRLGNPAGYVIHDRPESAYHSIAIGTGPFFVNTVVGLLLGAAAFVGATRASTAFYVLLWLGISIATHSFPSTGDAKAIWRSLWRWRTPILARILGLPVVIIIYVGALGSAFWLDLIYGVAVAWGIPRLFLK